MRPNLCGDDQVDNTEDYTASTWKTHMILADTVGIDAFALNIAAGSSINEEQIANAFAAAQEHGSFQLFFSFDYAGNGAWAKSDVTALIQQYGGNSAHFKRDGKPFVSTFEGPGSAADWVEIKAQTGCFFIPDWSSLGAKPALELEIGVADGLFSWASWSWGGESMNTYTDASYLQYLDGKPYMMPAAPWFYTNLPGYDKNWMWPVRTMNLWEQRWTEILFAQPDYVEIISWNDFGESHYIGLTENSPPFTTGKSTFDYVSHVRHDGWRYQLSAWASLYKSGKATITDELVTATYLLHHVEDCKDGDTIVNTASQLQYEYSPSDVLEGGYYVSYTAVLASVANVSLSVGGQTFSAPWIYTPVNNVGVYHGYTYIGTQTGDVVVTLNRGGSSIAVIEGDAIGGCTEDGYANFNPAVGSAYVQTSVSATTSPDLDELVCTQGTGATGFAAICGLTCSYGYCPISACVCTALGLQKKLPVATGLSGYSKIDTNYIGLCSWAYTYGFKDNGAVTPYCSSTEITLTTPTVSPFLPDACIDGRSNGVVAGSGINALCSFTCNYGWCPIHICTCTATGALVDLPGSITTSGTSAAQQYSDNAYIVDMCKFSCQYGYCPLDMCYTSLGFAGHELSGPWTSIDCSYGSLTSDLNPSYERWADADAEDAWKDLLDYFESYKASATIEKTDSSTTYNGFQFSQIIADRIHATSNRLCEYVPDANCDTIVQCDDQSSGGATGVSSPAGYMIINSIANVHTMVDVLYNSIQNAVTDYNGLTTEMVEAFVDLTNSKELKLTLDAVGLIYGLVAAPFWNSWLKKMMGDSFRNFGNTAGTLKDSMGAIVSNSLTMIKDSLSTTKGIETGLAFQALATVMGTDMQEALVSNAHLLFSGEDTTTLNGLMTNGSSGGVWSSTSPSEETNNFYKALVVMTLPVAWMQGASSGAGSFWMTGEALAADFSDITSCNGAVEAANERFKGLTFENTESAFVCDEATDTPYWLVYVGRECDIRYSPRYGTCNGKGSITAPPGMSKIDGKNFGGLTTKDLLLSSLNAYAANGNANGWSSVDLNEWNAVADVGDNGVQAAGVFSNPFCSVSEAADNWENYRDTDNYPCN